MKQSRAMSLVESVINIAVGFGLSVALQAIVLPVLGVQIPLAANLAFGAVMTLVSVARQFLLRRLFEALHIRRPLSAFAQAVIAERFRQIEIEGWDSTHDDAHRVGEIARAGAAYAMHPGAQSSMPGFWPWSDEWWKPQGFRRDLVRAAALIFAEGEKFDRSRNVRRT